MQMPQRRAGRRPERSRRHLFILSALMHELPEKSLKAGDGAFLDAGITAEDRAGLQARLSPGDTAAYLEGGQLQHL